MNLSELSAPQLRELRDQVAAALTKREAQEKEAAKQQILAIAKELNMTVAEILGSGGDKKPKARPAVPIKYIDPANPDNKWTGRGRAPKWADDLDKVGALETARV